MQDVYVIGEIGINHNGSLETAKKLIDVAVKAGADAVKFQKRDVDTVYSQEIQDLPRESPWGKTNGDQKRGLELSLDDYREIDRYCKIAGIDWFFSAWDVYSQLNMRNFGCKYNKVASAMLGHKELLEMIAGDQKHTFISTGMSTMNEISSAITPFLEAGCPFELMHCNSTYPMRNLSEANLAVMQTLRDTFGCSVGYSGHEVGLAVTLAAVALGATSVERHITLDRSMYGSDQASSIEPGGFCHLVKDIRAVSEAIGSPLKTITEAEQVVRDKLRYYE
jgi:N-acetylneuraminate synthase